MLGRPHSMTTYLQQPLNQKPPLIEHINRQKQRSVLSADRRKGQEA